MSLGAAIKIDSDGGYKDLVIRIASDGSVPENECPKILYNLKVSKPGVIAINLWIWILTFENAKFLVYITETKMF